jgi:hypothetical protein
MRQYFKIVVTKHDGEQYLNNLKLSEVGLISQLCKFNREVAVRRLRCTDKEYKLMFGL